MELRHSDSVYAEWRALNYANQSTSVLSDLVTIDTTPPIVDYVYDFVDADVPSLGDDDGDVDFVGAASFLAGVRFNAWDPESAVARVEICLGSLPGAHPLRRTRFPRPPACYPAPDPLACYEWSQYPSALGACFSCDRVPLLVIERGAPPRPSLPHILEPLP